MLTRNIRIGLCLCVAFLATTAAQAREMPQPPDLDRIRLRAGPVLLNPTLAIPNAGIDTNVFNEPDYAEPDKDFTITFTPAADVWMRMGPLVDRRQREGRSGPGIAEFDSERSANRHTSRHRCSCLSTG